MLLSRLEFGSYLAYCPHGDSELAKKSKDIVNAIKTERNVSLQPIKFMSERISEKIKLDIDNLPFKHFFGPDAFLVPVPKSSLMQADTLWVSEKIARALSNQGFGNVSPLLKRTKAVAKSAISRPGERPKAIDHYDSIEVSSHIPRPKEVVLVDDVITRGATLIGCASRLKDAFPDATIRAFAVVRTISSPDEFKLISDPCIGVIQMLGDQTTRRP